eukprot:ANDGO_03338.mRNA.1 Vacuolar protein sorting-associated protein 36
MDRWRPCEVTSSFAPVLWDEENEIIVVIEKHIRLYNGDDATDYDDGDLILSTHRLLWLEKEGQRRALQLHLSHVASVKTQAGFFPGVFSSPKLTLHLVPVSVSSSDLSSSPDAGVRQSDDLFTTYFKLSFRSKSSMDGGRDQFLLQLRKILNQKKWVSSKSAKNSRQTVQRGFESRSAGISGIINMVTKQSMAQKSSLSEAFSDLDALMKYAEELVKLADRVALIDDSEKSEFDSMLVSAGILNPVTKQVAGERFHRELAKQLGDFIAAQLPKNHGMMSLIDVYVMYNRARGTDMISPEDLDEAVKVFPKLGIELTVRSFSSNSAIRVVQSASFDPKPMNHKIAQLARERTCITEIDLSKELKMSIPVAKHYLQLAEEMCVLCRDESSQGVFFYPNFFLEGR